MMRVNVIPFGIVVSPDFRRQIERRVHQALFIVEESIRQIEITLTKSNQDYGNRSGKHCRIIVQTQAEKTILLEDWDSDLENLLDRSMEQLSKLIYREFAEASDLLSVAV